MMKKLKDLPSRDIPDDALVLTQNEPNNIKHYISLKHLISRLFEIHYNETGYISATEEDLLKHLKEGLKLQES